MPFPEKVNANFMAWLGEQESRRIKFTDEQRHWLEMIRDHIAANLSIEPDDFEYAPFAQHGGMGKGYPLFSENLGVILAELNQTLVA